ncbi:hypothetical protein Tco_0616199 [Tanacetum coccineum]
MKQYSAYTMCPRPFGVVYEGRGEKKRFMRGNEVYKSGDGTLTDVRDQLMNMLRLNQVDRGTSACMVKCGLQETFKDRHLCQERLRQFSRKEDKCEEMHRRNEGISSSSLLSGGTFYSPPMPFQKNMLGIPVEGIMRVPDTYC